MGQETPPREPSEVCSTRGRQVQSEGVVVEIRPPGYLLPFFIGGNLSLAFSDCSALIMAC